MANNLENAPNCVHTAGSWWGIDRYGMLNQVLPLPHCSQLCLWSSKELYVSLPDFLPVWKGCIPYPTSCLNSIMASSGAPPPHSPCWFRHLALCSYGI